MTKQSKRRSTSKLFAKQAFLPTERADEFQAFQKQARNELRPNGAIEEIYFRDIVRATWEIIRFSRAKTELIKSAYPMAVQSLLRKLSPTAAPFLNDFVDTEEPVHGTREELSLEWLANSHAQSRVRAFLKKFNLDDGVIEAEAIALAMPMLEKLDGMVSSLQRQRRRAFLDLYWSREGYAVSLRKVVNQITDGEPGNVRRLELPSRRSVA